MATKFTFGNRTIVIPGAYSQIGSGITNPPLSLSYGNVLIVDTGKYSGYNGGAGVSGTLKSGKDSIQFFDNLEDFRKRIRGEMFWFLAQKLFHPSRDLAKNGVSGINFIKACSTTPAEITMLFGELSTSSSLSQTEGGSLVLQCRDEGVCGNGVKTGSYLTRGFGVKMNIGVLDPTKFYFSFYAGSFTGLDADGEPYTDFPGQGTLESSSKETLIVESTEVSTMAELKTWMDSNSTFAEYFKIKTYIPVGTGAFDSTDQSLYSDFVLATGGTETYSQAEYVKVLENITTLDYSFVLSDRTETEAKSHFSNTLMANHIANESKYGEFLFIGGGRDANSFDGSPTSSTEIAKFFDSDAIVVVHAGIKKNYLSGAGFKEYGSIVKTALVLGRIAGLPPEIPGTFKDINMDADMHDLSEKQEKIALGKGVLYTKLDMTRDFIISQSISCLQNNDFMINPDGSSYEISIKRIAAQLNKELEVNAYKQLLKREDGTNRGSLSTAVVIQWTKSYLIGKTVSPITPSNLILGFEQVTCTVKQDAYFVQYGFYPNTPVNKLFFTGVMLDKAL